MREQKLQLIEEDRPKNKLLELSITQDHIVVLTIHTFDKKELEKAGLDFEDFLRTIFARIREQQIKMLVIDLRHNVGGWDLYGSLLYSYLSQGKFQFYKCLVPGAAYHPGLAA